MRTILSLILSLLTFFAICLFSRGDDYIRALIPTNMGYEYTRDCSSNVYVFLGGSPEYVPEIVARQTDNTNVYWVLSINIDKTGVTQETLINTLTYLGYTNVIVLYCPNNTISGWYQYTDTP